MSERGNEPQFEYVSSNESDTARLGLAIGDELIPGLVLGLNGTLGSGKTRLTQAIGSSLGIPDGEVVSPTFTICVPHEGRLAFLHLDAYRIKEPEEVDELGLDELAENGVVLIIEWAERIQDYLPPIDVEIWIDVPATDSRRFRVQSNSERGQKLVASVFERLVV